MPGIGVGGGTFKQRARRAEAEAGAVRAAALSTEMKRDARAFAQRRDMAEMTESLGWRLTAPFRVLARRLGGREGDGR